jgi:hypothetical protein
MSKPRTVSKPSPIRMDERAVAAFVTIPPDSSFFRSWLWIGFLINSGAEPEADHIVALLRGGEPPPADRLTLKYIADLIDRARGRGRPRKHPVQVEQHKRNQARRDIADIKARGLVSFAKTKHIPLESASDRHRKAKKTLSIARNEWDSLIESVRQKLNAAGGKMTKEEVAAVVKASGFNPPPEE